MQGQTHLVDKHGSAGLAVSSELEMLAALDGELLLGLASGALHTENNLLGGLSLLVEHGLGLTSESGLLAIVTTLSLGDLRVTTLLVLGDLVGFVLGTLLAEGVAGLGNVHLFSDQGHREEHSYRKRRIRHMKQRRVERGGDVAAKE